MIRNEVSGRYVDAAEMFGSLNDVAMQPAESVDEGLAAWSALGGDTAFQLLCLGLLVTIALLLHYRNAVGTLATVLWRGFTEDFESNRKDTTLTSGFFKIAGVTGIVAMTTALVRTTPLWLTDGVVEREWIVPAAAAAVTAVTAAIALYQWLLLSATAFVADGRDFIATLLYIKKVYFVAVAIFIAPVVLLSALSPEAGGTGFYILAAECLILSFLFLKETFMLFIRKKVPIFQWFLYLCTVEAFPLTLICASIARFR